ncbi:hypothetical protein [Bdellovibrio svalbardensis]|uniref:Uncharacterized protein n=1 Tax=Bdellovibrio svalbardensis TaxID=2972972 RepID=A0ABT6DI17_9BACT|nr:hypothetical protein [Bdellovibrio svalbardensis]MDG0815491.1 hypothetical protein [Bdellovibrio svalbardensis]
MMLIFLCILGFFQDAKAADISVIDVRRNITLSEDDAVYKDFYISASAGSGLKKNLVVTAVRKINVRDASGANSFGEILIPVGQLKIIAIFDKVAVAREFNLLSRDELPMLEQTGIMTGDRIDLQGSFIDNSKPKKRKVASDDEKAAGTTTVVTTLTTSTTTTTTTPAAAPLPNVAAAAGVHSPSPLTPPTAAGPVVQPPALPSTEKLLQGATEFKPAVAKAEAVPHEAASKAASEVAQETNKAAETLEKVADSDNNSGHE